MVLTLTRLQYPPLPTFSVRTTLAPAAPPPAPPFGIPRLFSTMSMGCGPRWAASPPRHSKTARNSRTGRESRGSDSSHSPTEAMRSRFWRAAERRRRVAAAVSREVETTALALALVLCKSAIVAFPPTPFFFPLPPPPPLSFFGLTAAPATFKWWPIRRHMASTPRTWLRSSPPRAAGADAQPVRGRK